VRRAAAALGAAWGLALLARPEDLLRAAGADPGLPYAVPAARVLGARHLLQAAILTARPVEVAPWAAATDALHAASMLPLAASSRYRGPALVSATVAGLLSALTRGRR
jgi:hypothetical protein